MKPNPIRRTFPQLDLASAAAIALTAGLGLGVDSVLAQPTGGKTRLSRLPFRP